MEGAKLLEFEAQLELDAPHAHRDDCCSRRGGARFCATASSTATRISAIIPSSRRGMGEARRIEAVNLFDYGCVRIFPPRFVSGVVELYLALKTNDADRVVHAYELWGFKNLSRETIEAMNIWARFICGPTSTIAFARSPTASGRANMAGARSPP